MVLVHAKFAYNNSVNRSIGKIPFQMVYGWSLNGVVDLIQFPYVEERKIVDRRDFVDNLQSIHEHLKK